MRPRAALFAWLWLFGVVLCGQSLSGRRAPDFSLVDSSGNAHHVADYRGHWQILEFVHPDCERCPALTKSLSGLKAKYGSNLEILGVVIPRQEGMAAAEKFIQTANAGFPMAIDLTQVAIAYFQPNPGRPYYETPHWFAIDPEGNVAADWSPEAAESGEWLKRFELLVACSTPGTNCSPAKQTWNETPPVPSSAVENLHKAVRAGNLKLVQEYIGEGVPVDARDAMGGTPLHDAAWAGEREVAAFLIESGADVNTKHLQGASTPLHYAVLTNHPEVVELLLDHGADQKALYQKSQIALHLAAARGYSRVATILIAHGADIKARDEAGATALSEASWTGEAEMVTMLLAKGADVNDVNPETGMTALHAACSRGYVAVARALLEGGARVDVRDKSGATPLYLALQFQRMDVVDLLIRGNLPKAQSIDVKAVLRDEVMRGRTNVVEMLLSRMPPLGSTTLLHDAALKGHVDVLELLLKHGAQVDSLNAQGATALHDAALAGQKAAAEVLIRHGANVNARDAESGETPLHRAASWGRRGVVELLIEQKADPHIKDKNGRTPLDLAIANSQGEVAEVLKRIP